MPLFSLQFLLLSLSYTLYHLIHIIQNQKGTVTRLHFSLGTVNMIHFSKGTVKENKNENSNALLNKNLKLIKHLKIEFKIPRKYFLLSLFHVSKNSFHTIYKNKV